MKRIIRWYPLCALILLTGCVSMSQNACLSSPSRAILPEIAEKGSMVELQSHVAKIEDINQNDCYGWNALHRAVERGDLNMVIFLLNNGSDINSKTDFGWSAIDIAKRKSNSVMLSYLNGYILSKDKRNYSTQYFAKIERERLEREKMRREREAKEKERIELLANRKEKMLVLFSDIPEHLLVFCEDAGAGGAVLNIYSASFRYLFTGKTATPSDVTNPFLCGNIIDARLNRYDKTIFMKTTFAHVPFSEETCSPVYNDRGDYKCGRRFLTFLDEPKYTWSNDEYSLYSA